MESPSQERKRKHNQDPESFWSVRESLTSSIKNKLSTLPPSSSSRCVYRVPEKLRIVNEEAFTPRLVSIGPLHRGKPHLQAMEEYKLRCLKTLLDRIGDIMSVFDFIVRQELNVRRHYQDDNKLSNEEFSEMILLDGIFIVELFLKNSFPGLRDENDEIFDKQWMSSDLLHDMLLIENQLPLFVPHTIYHKYHGSYDGKSFSDLAYEYFKNVGNTHRLPAEALSSGLRQPRHLVEYLQMAHLPNLIQSSTRKRKFEYTRSATELQEAGVKFKGSGTCSFEIKFSEGVLTITQVTVNEWTETFFRNLIAFEQCEHMHTRYISDYVILMDSLINTAKDVDLLIHSGIVEDLLGDSDEVSNLFNSLYKETVTEDTNFYFAELCGELNKYSRDPWHRWKATWYNWKVILRNDYFGNPWSGFSVIAAVVLLSLTIIQTVCSVMSL